MRKTQPLAMISLRNRPPEKFKKFKEILKEEPSKVFAEILWNVWNGSVAEELRLRASEDLGTTIPLTWLRYLQTEDSERSNF